MQKVAAGEEYIVALQQQASLRKVDERETVRSFPHQASQDQSKQPDVLSPRTPKR